MFGILPLGFTAAMRTHDASSFEFAQDVVAALKQVNISQKEAALTMGITESQFASQLAGREHLSLWRLSKLPNTFQVALWSIRLRRVGYDILPPGQLADLVSGVKALITPERKKQVQA